MVSEPTPTAAFSGGAAWTVTLVLTVLPLLQWTVKVVEPVLSQSPASLALLALSTVFTVGGGAGVTEVAVRPVAQPCRLTAVSIPSGTDGSWILVTAGAA